MASPNIVSVFPMLAAKRAGKLAGDGPPADFEAKKHTKSLPTELANALAAWLVNAGEPSPKSPRISVANFMLAPAPCTLPDGNAVELDFGFRGSLALTPPREPKAPRVPPRQPGETAAAYCKRIGV